MKKLIAVCLVLIFCSVAFATTLLYEKQNSGTDLDNILFVISNDEGLVANTTPEDRARARIFANEMNRVIVLLFQQNGALTDGVISVEDVFNWNVALRKLPRGPKRWSVYHGQDAVDVETAYHLVRKDGATWNIYGENAIDIVFDGIYHMGFMMVDENNAPVTTFDPTKQIYFQDENGNVSTSLQDVSNWLNLLMAEDLKL